MGRLPSALIPPEVRPWLHPKNLIVAQIAKMAPPPLLSTK